MPRRAEVEIAPGRDLGLRRAEPLGEGGLGEDEVESAQALDQLRQRGQETPDGVGQLGEDAQLLVALLQAEAGESLLSGIVSSGSTNTVAPLCERSWMMPRTGRRASSRTGTT